jgi:uncharacterized protein
VSRPRLVRHVPVFPWSASGRWSPRPAALAVLVVGLWTFGTGEALMIDARLGNSPWTVLAEGLAGHVGMRIGTMTVIVSGVVLLGWAVLRERPGIGTLGNALLIGVAVDVMEPRLPVPAAVGWRVVEAVAGIVVVAVGGALYLSTQLGPGPRDGWMTGLARRLDQPIARVRFTLEAVVLVAGWLLGGTVGVTTFAFALLIGHTLAAVLGVLTRVALRPDLAGVDGSAVAG